ncbi:MAG: hypothetical protein K0R59_1314 [Sphingobacterium sp.]|jgi:hypothetical protein|uniref:hypothetical protein n=1 Tax=unclassified Sphingobacterium TaxID=2609468 RepID=UPI000987C4FB|nr:hypothetical protein [Sphingobacterium sp. CZ-UAM]MDF2516018.1 hypothetical protein [Sphingobacterium sp.]OOG18543.1 hypothetical protein BWD42_00730 [Sphingobacterium sp. CZ-UAM]
MRIIILTLIISAFALTSCGGNLDFGYNEKIADLFYQCKEKLDESYNKLLEGAYDVDKADELSYEMTLKEVQALNSYIKGIKSEVNALTPSESAKSFHSTIMTYMTRIADGYGPLLIKYVDEQKKGARQALLRDITDERAKITVLADTCLEKQVEFLNRVGIKVTAVR